MEKIYDLIKRIYINYTEDKKLMFFRYICTGGIVTVINIILLYLFTEMLLINYNISNIISMLICITITYVLSKKLIFVKKVKIRRSKWILKLCNNSNYFNFNWYSNTKRINWKTTYILYYQQNVSYYCKYN